MAIVTLNESGQLIYFVEPGVWSNEPDDAARFSDVREAKRIAARYGAGVADLDPIGVVGMVA